MANYLVGLRAVTVLYGDTASVYGIRTEAVSTLGDTVHYGPSTAVFVWQCYQA